MTGRLAVDARTVETSDAVLAAVDANAGRAWIVDSLGDYTSADLHHDGARYVLRCSTRINPRAHRHVEVRLRGAFAA